MSGIQRLCRYGNCTTKNELKKLIDITYTNKTHLLFGSPSLKYFIVKRVWLGVVMEWVTFWEVCRKTCE